ncbi:stage II sporulation protein D [Clostridium sp. MB40-C1]|uniref:stage II sporulation protein D n=1 Tax=Clostridium sp. MB40-C1 TaxID=3070996 RepID=UPI0027E13ED7|nr:stage II sporulation protein D [Clostridium sp. MB40-C1]WMJ79665.1 stage II sporulation protein D [Clostridium sp. MB40-C1]
MKKIFLSIGIFICFTLILSILIVGIDNKVQIKHKNNKSDQMKTLQEKNTILDNYDIKDLNIDVYITKDKKIKTMNIEEYVMGVVAGEMPANFHPEALKAQAVAARTYGLAHLEKFGAAKKAKSTEGDVNDTIAFQVYMNKQDRMDSWPQKYAQEYWNKLKVAVEETEGEVLAYDNKLVMAPYYFSTSSGKTEDAVDVFGKDIPYLKSVDSPGEEEANKYKSQFRYTYNDFINNLSSIVSSSKLTPSTLKDQIKILERSKGGSVKQIKIVDKNISGAKFRSLFGLSSSNFSIEFEQNSICINCTGYGHGVGMSQWGAYSMAKQGGKYKDILKHYYNGVDVVKFNVKK